MSAAPRPRPILYWCVSLANGGLVFATPEKVLAIDRVYRALETSRTWGEFRALMPADEYERIVSIVFDEAGENRPGPDVPFNAAVVPGYCDGDYPPWVQPDAEGILPAAVIDRFGSWVATPISGRYLHFDPSVESRVVDALAAAGFDVVRRDDLMFA